MPDQAQIRRPQYTPLSCTTSIERNLLAFTADAIHAGPVLTLEHRLDSGKASEGGRYSAQDLHRGVVVEEKERSSTESERARQLRGEDKHVESGLHDVSAKGYISKCIL